VEITKRTQKNVKTKNCGSAAQRNKVHKMLIIGDGHVRNCAANVKSNINGNFEVQGVVKPGAGDDILANSVISKIKGLSKSDVVVFCGGANDIGRNNSSKAIHQIINFIAHYENTNIILMTAPPRYDLMQSSCVNNEINLFSRKLKKVTKVHHHTSILDIVTVRNLFTTHGLHLNGQGKEKLANQIYSILKQEEISPTPLKWKKSVLDVMEVINVSNAEIDEMDQPGNTNTTSKDLGMSCSSNKRDEILNLKGSKPKPETKKVQQESERVQNVVLDSTNDIEPSTLDNTIKKCVMCENSDLKAPTATPSLDEEPPPKKPPTTKNEDFCCLTK